MLYQLSYRPIKVEAYYGLFPAQCQAKAFETGKNLPGGALGEE
ncbi:MAG: hypothetical protein ACI4X9_06740 [Kiritimatiellia bacterium]